MLPGDLVWIPAGCILAEKALSFLYGFLTGIIYRCSKAGLQNVQEMLTSAGQLGQQEQDLIGHLSALWGRDSIHERRWQGKSGGAGLSASPQTCFNSLGTKLIGQEPAPEKSHSSDANQNQDEV